MPSGWHRKWMDTAASGNCQQRGVCLEKATSASSRSQHHRQLLEDSGALVSHDLQRVQQMPLLHCLPGLGALPHDLVGQDAGGASGRCEPEVGLGHASCRIEKNASLGAVDPFKADSFLAVCTGCCMQPPSSRGCCLSRSIGQSLVVVAEC